MSNSPDTQLKPRIMITGETAGTGASTTSKILAEQLKLPIISGGRYFRGLANRFDLFQQERASLSQDHQYQSFLEKYQEVFSTQGLPGVSAILEEGIQQGAKGDILAKFSAAVETNQRKTGQIDTVWDYIVDQKTLSDALQQPGFVWESKLAVLSLSLDQLQSAITGVEFLAVPYLRVLLKLDPLVAAQRVGERENRQVDLDEILIRKQRDFARYGDLYQIGGQRVTHQDLYHHADVTIDTQHLTPAEVAIQVLGSYIDKIIAVVQEHEVFAMPVINDINSALSNLKA